MTLTQQLSEKKCATCNGDNANKDDKTIDELLAKIQKLEEKVIETEKKEQTAVDKIKVLEKKIESLQRELDEARRRIKELEKKKPGFDFSRFFPQNCAKSQVRR